jgi:hypothetical protein
MVHTAIDPCGARRKLDLITPLTSYFQAELIMVTQKEQAPIRQMHLVELMARNDARTDRHQYRPSEYLQFAAWVQAGVISREAWQCYQAAYTAKRVGMDRKAV